MSAVDPQQLVLLLDLSRDNPIPEDEVLEHVPQSANRTILRISDFGAQATTRGQVSSRWRSWTLAVDRMLAQARELTETRRTSHYYIAGRASLPLFAYLGLRRGKQGLLTVLNARDSGTWDIIPTQPVDGFAAPPFFGEPAFTPGDHPEGHLAVVLSTGYSVSPDEVSAYLEGHQERHAGTVVLQTETGAGRWLTAENAAGAVEQVGELFRGLRRFAPRARGVGLFLAGPAPLAVMAGRALNPHIHRPIWIPAYSSGVYGDAVRWPQGAVHGGELRILVMTASPANMGALRTREEERQLKASLLDGLHGRERLKIEVIRGATVDDILAGMNRFKPHVLHIGAHGNNDGDLSFLDEQGDAALVPLAGMAAAVKAAGEQLQMILLNACFSDAATRVLVDHVDCAIGVRKALADDSALEFTRAFYGALGHGCSVGQAYEQGLAALKLRVLPNSRDIELRVREGCDTQEWVPLPALSPG